MFSHIAERPQYFLNCAKRDRNGKRQFRLVGDAYGEMPKTKWAIIASGFSKGGGPFQWFHRYDRFSLLNPKKYTQQHLFVNSLFIY